MKKWGCFFSAWVCSLVAAVLFCAFYGLGVAFGVTYAAQRLVAAAMAGAAMAAVGTTLIVIVSSDFDTGETVGWTAGAVLVLAAEVALVVANHVMGW
jgi:hypothetical protein